jgi:hypothetical protein
MKIVSAWLLFAVLILGVKLFTYEYHLADDPTCGIAARSRPSFTNHQLLSQSDVVLFSTENDYPGSALYQAMVSWGYIGVLVAGPVILYWRRKRHSLKSAV